MKALEKLVKMNEYTDVTNHILVDDSRIVATDMSIVIIKEIENEEDKGKVGFIINPKAKHTLEPDSQYNGYPFHNGNFGYPNYHAIIPTEWEKCRRFRTFIKGLQFLTWKHNIALDYIKYASFFKLCDKECGIITHYKYKTNLCVKTDKGYTICMCPLQFIL